MGGSFEHNVGTMALIKMPMRMMIGKDESHAAQQTCPACPWAKRASMPWVEHKRADPPILGGDRMRLPVDEPTSPVPEILSPRTLPSFNSLMSGTRLAGWQASDIYLQALVAHRRGKAKPKARHRGKQPSMTMRARNLGGTKEAGVGIMRHASIRPILPLGDMRFKEAELDRGAASIIRDVVAWLPWSADPLEAPVGPDIFTPSRLAQSR